jgi:hypothetical protein
MITSSTTQTEKFPEKLTQQETLNQENTTNPALELSNTVEQTAKPIFNQAFKNLPECPPNDETLFLTTTEENLARILGIMGREPLVGDVMMGVSGFYTLNVAAVRAQNNGQKIPYLLLVDCSTRVEKFWIKMQEIMQEAKTPQDVSLKILDFASSNPEEFWKPSHSNNSQCVKEASRKRAYTDVNNLALEIESGTSWLSSQEKFETIKQIFKDRFAFVRLDFFDGKSVRALCSRISQLNFKFDSIYLSNMREHAEIDRNLPGFHESLKELKSVITDKTLFIDTKPRVVQKNYTGDLTQRVVRNIWSAKIEDSFPYSPGLVQRVFDFLQNLSQ